MRGIHHHHVHTRLYQQIQTLETIRSRADGGAHDQASQFVLAGVGILAHLLDILDGDEPFEHVVFIHHQKLFDAVLVQVPLGLLQRRARRHRDQIFMGHDLINTLIKIGFKTQVAVGQDAFQAPVLGHRQAGDTVLLHDIQCIADAVMRIDGDGIDDHAAFRLFDPIHLQRLFLRGHILVNHAQAALPRQADGGPGFRYRIHCRGDQGNVQPDLVRQPGGQIGVPRKNGGMRRNQQHIVKCQALPDRIVKHGFFLLEELFLNLGIIKGGKIMKKRGGRNRTPLFP